jgi:beta-1,2-mannobiose phosphorylase / 1,2-beta-oligomannan phosphorylase
MPSYPNGPRRISEHPVVAPGAVDGYEAIFNAGVVHVDDRYHLFARGVRVGYRRNPAPGPRFLDYISDVLVFHSDDGIDYRFHHVLALSSPHGVHCFEEPRVQQVRSHGDVHWVMTYTNLPAPESGQPWRIGAHRLYYDGQRFQLDQASATLLGPDGVANKDAVVFNLRDGKVALIHRVHPDMQLAVFESLDHLWNPGEAYWHRHLQELDHHVIIRPSRGALAVGAGAPPVATEAGLLLFFHERRGDGVYTMRVALLDDTSGHVVAVLPEEIMRPELHWERAGDVDEVVFVQGAHRRPDGTIYLTYGAADRAVGAAEVAEGALLDLLLSEANAA